MTTGAMIIVLLIIAGVSVKPYSIIEQEHVIHSGHTTVIAFDHPALQPTASKYQGTGPMKTTVGESLRISPYDADNGTSGWSHNGTGEQAEYVCRISWITGYAVYIAGIDIFHGDVPWKSGNLTLVDARGPADGRRNELHMPEYIRLDGSTGTTTG